MKKAIVALCLLVMVTGFGGSKASDPTTEWNALVDEYLDKVYYPLSPTAATAAAYTDTTEK